MRGRPAVRQEGPPLPPKMTGAFLGLWVALMLTLAFLVVPALFSTCART